MRSWPTWFLWVAAVFGVASTLRSALSGGPDSGGAYAAGWWFGALIWGALGLVSTMELMRRRRADFEAQQGDNQEIDTAD